MNVMLVYWAAAAAAFAASLTQAAPQGPGAFPPRPPRPPFVPPVGVPPAYVPIVNQNFDLNGVDGSYTFGYESADGSTRQETGVVNNPGTPVEAMAVTGSYSYVGADGVPVTVNYVADENGFQPVGNIVHPSIQRAVADQVAFARGGPPPPPGTFPASGPRFPPPQPPRRPF